MFVGQKGTVAYNLTREMIDHGVKQRSFLKNQGKKRMFKAEAERSAGIARATCLSKSVLFSLQFLRLEPIFHVSRHTALHSSFPVLYILGTFSTSDINKYFEWMDGIHWCSYQILRFDRKVRAGHNQVWIG